MYFLILGFLAGAVSEVRSVAADQWRVPVTVVSFIVPLVIILYCARLSQQGVIKGVSARPA
jgi:hypothetical protein